jgi:hypothetical protein
MESDWSAEGATITGLDLGHKRSLRAKGHKLLVLYDRFFSNIVETRFFVSSLSIKFLLTHAIVSKQLDLIKRFYLLVSSLQLDQGKLIRDLFGF